MARGDGIALAAAGAGALFLWSGVHNGRVLANLQNLIKGKPPSDTSAPNNADNGTSGGINLVSPSGYANPFAGVQNLVPERVDMGVDFSGTGPVVAIGSGTITQTVNFGWPNSTFICIHLDSGAYKGKYAYFAEDIQASVKTGQHVNAGDPIGTMFNGTSGIECGWAAPPGIGATMAAISLQWNKTNSTAYGVSFNKFLMSLGVPSGQVHDPVIGSVGAGFP